MSDSSTPRSQQIANDLWREIEAGERLAGSLLPSERELVAKYETTKSTVSKAIQILRSQGLVSSELGRGHFVRKPRQRLERQHTERYQWEKDRARLTLDERKQTGATEFDTKLAIDQLNFDRWPAKYETVPAADDIARRFGVEAGTPMLRRRYLTGVATEEHPLNIAYSYLVRSLVEANPDLLDEKNEPWPGGTQNQLYTIGIELDRIVDTVTARPPFPDEMQLLGMDEGTAVLVLHKTSIDTNDQVVEFSEVILPGDRTEITHVTQLARWDA